MAGVHGKHTVFKLTNASSVLTDISSQLTDVQFPRTKDKAEDSGFGQTSKTFQVGLQDRTMSLTGIWNATVDGLFDGILNLDTSFAFEYGPAGNTVGNVKYTGNVYPVAYNVNSPIGGVVTFTATLQMTGDPTRGTY